MQRFNVRGSAGWVCLGERPVPRLVPDHGIPKRPISIAFFCPKCGELWAKVEIEGEPWHIITQSCSACPTASWMSHPSGSILLNWMEELTGDLPIGVLKWEFEMYLKRYDLEKEKESEQV